MEEKTLLSTRELAQFLSINEKMVYTLIAEKNLPATKATGKWLFPRHLVEQWLEAQTINFPKQPDPLPPYDGLLIIAGSNDILLDRTISLINQRYPEEMVAFGNMGSLGGIRALRRNHCHIASSHLIQKDGEEYNFGFAIDELGQMPGIINFCRREQGLLIEKGNPRNIRSVADLDQAGIKIINRPLGTGTRLLLDEELTKAGIEGNEIDGYTREVSRHLDLGLEVLSGRAQAGPCIRAVAELLDLDFVPIKWESFDLLILKDRFFDKGVQQFLGFLSEPPFKKLGEDLAGYDLGVSGKMLFPKES
ncbi:MAG: helix-turn-helix transcriptional regulator [Deltaproteobacteria bacterium]|nr:helix-turn-helix transcriptional regulator [Deltaproteobacteria bacterium]